MSGVPDDHPVPPPGAAGVIRVRHVPAAHSYVEHLLPVIPPTRADGGAQVVHLPDPRVPGAPPGSWWPHPVLEADWVREHAAEQDVVHLHFGTEGRTTAELDAWLDALEERGLPLVHTVHDIDHPHLHDQAPYRDQLARLVRRSDALLTLTRGAADRVEELYGRRPLVVPHPHVVPLDLLDAPRPQTDTFTIGLHLKSLRTNLAPMRALPALIEVLPALRARCARPVVLEVRGHDDVLDPTAPRHDPALARLVRALRDDPVDGVHVLLGPRLDDDALWSYLSGLDVSVLPYAWATHSGWVEACRDLGTWVLAPDVGPGPTRTGNRRIRRPLLYPLSYGGRT